MRLIKMFGLAAVAAAAVMALVGVTSASAEITELEKVVLCNEHVADNNSSACPLGHDFKEGTKIDALQIGTGTLLGEGFGDITCKGAHTFGVTSELLAHGLITDQTWLECEHGGSKCEVKSEHLPWLFLVLLKSTDVGYHLVITEHTDKVTGKKAGIPQVHVSGCPLVNCTFQAPASGVLFELLLEEKDVVADVLQEVVRTGGFCPPTSVWHAKFLIKCLLEGSSEEQACWPRMEEK